jgi:SAM-dependent methyltransferase
MTQDRIVQADLDWWVGLAPALEWIFARTYAQSAPHSYVVLGRTAGMTRGDYVRAGRVIHTFGRPAKFYAMTSIYLPSPDGRLKWWTMDREVTATNLINQATTDRLYGVQNAPSTDSGVQTPYDSLATAYDQLHPASEAMTGNLRGAVTSLSGDFPPAILDVGCGTGRVLDLGVTTPDRYAGVDPSQPMLNQLVRKHADVGAVYPMRIEHALTAQLFTPGQFEIVTALLSDVDQLDDDTIARLAGIASRGLIVARGDEVTVVDTRRSVDQARH